MKQIIFYFLFRFLQSAFLLPPVVLISAGILLFIEYVLHTQLIDLLGLRPFISPEMGNRHFNEQDFLSLFLILCSIIFFFKGLLEKIVQQSITINYVLFTKIMHLSSFFIWAITIPQINNADESPLLLIGTIAMLHFFTYYYSRFYLAVSKGLSELF